MPQKKSLKIEDMKFEEALLRVEEINSILAKGECELDEALELFSEGTKLADFCMNKIKTAKQKIQIVTEVDDDENNE